LEAYTKILRGMEKKLAEVEVEKEAKEVELREVRSKHVQIPPSINVSSGINHSMQS
jgi:hypothetical protein